MGFWPNDVTAETIPTPQGILYEAGRELQDYHPHLRFDILEELMSDRVISRFRMMNTKSDVAVNLLEIIQPPGQEYPVTISPPQVSLPDFLRKDRYIPGRVGIGDMHRRFESKPGKVVPNEWFCSTATEFRSKLIELLATSEVKSIVSNVLVSSLETDAPGHSSEEE